MTSHTKDVSSHLPVHLRSLFFSRDAYRPIGTQLGGCIPQGFAPTKFLPREVEMLLMNPDTTPWHLAHSVHRFGLFQRIGCELLGPDNLRVISSFPVDGGGFAEIWVCERDDGRKVVIKSFRRYSSSSNLPTFLRLYNEARIYIHMNGINCGNFVPFLGIYTSPEHPFSLIFDFMDNGNLRDYLKNNKETKKAELLLQIALGLQSMHNQGIIHGNLKIVNILVDGHGRARIGGMGAVFITPSVAIDQLFHGAAPEMVVPGAANAGASKASDLYSFGVVSWEVFTGKAPFSDGAYVAGVHSMLTGHRPERPPHSELSDPVWKLIKGCWKVDPTKRKTIDDVIAVLEAEVYTR